MDTIALVGRGPSLDRVRLPEGLPIMAISSGIFALPPHHPDVKHFCSLDQPKYFVHPLKEGVDVAWANDPGITHWDFWSSKAITKHVPQRLNKAGHERPAIPLEVVPEQWRAQVEHELEKERLSGYQEGWADYPSVMGWEVVPQRPPSFGPKGVIGLCCSECKRNGLDAIRHTVFFAVQLAARLGFRKCLFAGVDLEPDRYEIQRELLKHWQVLAARDGMRWEFLGK
jgi:hypothetical protein